MPFGIALDLAFAFGGIPIDQGRSEWLFRQSLVCFDQMKSIVISLAMFGCVAYSQPTGNVLHRVYELRYGTIMGTAFLIDYEDRQYFVTANHLMARAGSEAAIELMAPGSDGWKPFAVSVLHGKNKCQDVAVLVPKEKKLSNADPLPYPYNFGIGQEVYFLGFPYGLYTSFDARGLGVALVKHAYLSGRVPCASLMPDGNPDDELLLLDGLNNPGFSGGPVVAPDMFSAFTTVRIQKLIGVVSSFKNEPVPLQVNGQVVTSASVLTNTGIIIAVPIDYAVGLIKDYVEKQKKP